MGIVSGNEICKTLRATAKVVDNKKEIGQCTLHIDGPILVFCGNIKNPRIDSNIIVRAKLKKVCSQLLRVFNITKVILWFDGRAPLEKTSTQLKRAARRSSYDAAAVKSKLFEYFTNSSLTVDGVILKTNCIQLERGEAECEMYVQRNRDANSILYTKDTDIYSIAYKHVPESKKDNVFVCVDISSKTQNGLEIYDMSKFQYPHISRNIFRLCMALRGTDYTESVFTPTMLAAIFNSPDIMFAEYESSLLESHECVVSTLEFLTQTITSLQSRYRICVHKVQTPDVARLYWYINYCGRGISYSTEVLA